VEDVWDDDRLAGMWSTWDIGLGHLPGHVGR